jgi:hypothetical protein
MARDFFGNIIPGGVEFETGFNPTSNTMRPGTPPPQPAPAPAPAPQPQPAAQPQQQQQSQAPQAPRPQPRPAPNLVADAIEERLPLPGFPMIITTIDAVARKVPWYVWFIIGVSAALGGGRVKAKIMSWWG